jgi:hypothetical protein
MLVVHFWSRLVLAVFCTFSFISLLSWLLQLLFLFTLLLHLLSHFFFCFFILAAAAAAAVTAASSSSSSSSSNQVVKNFLLGRRLSFHWPLYIWDTFM